MKDRIIRCCTGSLKKLALSELFVMSETVRLR